MLRILSNGTFRHLYVAQVTSLIGTGLATVALGLLAWQLAGANAGLVLGTALAIKMVAYVTLAPVASALAARLPRRAFLVSLDLIRAVVVLFLPFVTEVGQVYFLIFLLQAASAGFTPAFQATIPDVLPEEADYTSALSLMRLAEDMEQVFSPMLAAGLLTLVSFPVLFGGTVAGFAVSAALVFSVSLPARVQSHAEPFFTTTTKGLRIYLATPRLRGLMAMELAVAAAGAMVYVNTVVLVQVRLGLGAPQVALAFAAFGAGSMAAAVLLPRVLDRMPDRPVMLAGAAVMVATVAVLPLVSGMAGLLPLWCLVGFGFALSQTPIGRILNRSAQPENRPAIFAAQFALSHACWLVTYPLAGWLGAAFGLNVAALGLAGLGCGAMAIVFWVWPAADPAELAHCHPELAPDHPHLATTAHGPHRHKFTIDALHQHWPKLTA